MYDAKLVVAVLANGKVLREQGDTVYLPFGHEYTLRFKNLNTVRALVRVSVDGQDATEGTSGLIVQANDTLDLERFIKGGNLGAGNRFKFIERTARIENGPRGVQMEDGLIRVEFEFEKQPVKVEYETIKRTLVDTIWDRRIGTPYIYPREFYCSTNAIGGTVGGDGKLSKGVGGVSRGMASGATFTCTSGEGILMNTATTTTDAVAAAQNAAHAYVNQVGITVPGAVSEQKFSTGAWFPVDGQKHVMVLKLLGVHGEQPITKPLTVKTKQKCTTCGHINKSVSRFCSECGTGLILT